MKSKPGFSNKSSKQVSVFIRDDNFITKLGDTFKKIIALPFLGFYKTNSIFIHRLKYSKMNIILKQ